MGDIKANGWNKWTVNKPLWRTQLVRVCVCDYHKWKSAAGDSWTQRVDGNVLVHLLIIELNLLDPFMLRTTIAELLLILVSSQIQSCFAEFWTTKKSSIKQKWSSEGKESEKMSEFCLFPHLRFPCLFPFAAKTCDRMWNKLRSRSKQSEHVRTVRNKVLNISEWSSLDKC